MDIFNHQYELSFVPTEDERRRFAWIPSIKTKNTLEKASQMNHTLPRDMLTMPGVENVNFVCACTIKFCLAIIHFYKHFCSLIKHMKVLCNILVKLKPLHLKVKQLKK